MVYHTKPLKEGPIRCEEGFKIAQIFKEKGKELSEASRVLIGSQFSQLNRNRYIRRRISRKHWSSAFRESILNRSWIHFILESLSNTLFWNRLSEMDKQKVFSNNPRASDVQGEVQRFKSCKVAASRFPRKKRVNQPRFEPSILFRSRRRFWIDELTNSNTAIIEKKKV